MPHLVDVLGVWHPVSVSGTPTERIATIAALQRGRIARRQLLQAGVSYAGIRRRVRNGELHNLHRGVFAVGHAATIELGRETTALLAVRGPGWLADRSATALWRMAGPPADNEPAHVLVTHRSAIRAAEIRVHRTTVLAARDARIHRGLPVTSPARSLLDFAASASPRELERAFNEAFVLGLVRTADVEDMLARARGRVGQSALRSLLENAGDPAITRSAAERLMLALIRDAQLPEPRVNARVFGYEVDFHWPAARFVLEFDGFRFHSAQRAFERDRLKDATLHANGWGSMRVTWRQLRNEPYAVVARLAQALAWAAGAARAD